MGGRWSFVRSYTNACGAMNVGGGLSMEVYDGADLSTKLSIVHHYFKHLFLFATVSFQILFDFVNVRGDVSKILEHRVRMKIGRKCPSKDGMVVDVPSDLGKFLSGEGGQREVWTRRIR